MGAGSQKFRLLKENAAISALNKSYFNSFIAQNMRLTVCIKLRPN